MASLYYAMQKRLAIARMRDMATSQEEQSCAASPDAVAATHRVGTSVAASTSISPKFCSPPPNFGSQPAIEEVMNVNANAGKDFVRNAERRSTDSNGDACSTSSYKKCNSTMSPSPSVSKSNNPVGQQKYTKVLECGDSSISFALSFKCPRTERRCCDGIYLSQAEQRDPSKRQKKWQRVTAIKTLRLQLRAPDTSITQALCDYMMSITTDKSVRHRRHELPWCVGNRQVCTWCFCVAAGLLSGSPNQWLQPGAKLRVRQSFDRAINAYKTSLHNASGGVIAVASKRKIHGYQRANVKEKAMSWLIAYTTPEENNCQTLTDSDKQHIQGITMGQLRKKYVEETKEKCSSATWGRAIHQGRMDGSFDLVFNKFKTQQECAECVAYVTLLAGKLTDEVRRHVEAQKKLHHEIARMERIAYGAHTRIGSMCTWAWSFGIDGYCTWKSCGPLINGKGLANLKGAPAGLGSTETMAFKTTGVLMHGFGYHLYTLDPRLSANSNSNIHCLHTTLVSLFNVVKDAENTMLTHWPKVLFVQVDGASDNKSKPFFRYLMWLVKKDVFETVVCSFLLVGHTHADYDQQFVPITYELRKGEFGVALKKQHS